MIDNESERLRRKGLIYMKLAEAIEHPIEPGKKWEPDWDKVAEALIMKYKLAKDD